VARTAATSLAAISGPHDWPTLLTSLSLYARRRVVWWVTEIPVQPVLAAGSSSVVVVCLGLRSGDPAGSFETTRRHKPSTLNAGIKRNLLFSRGVKVRMTGQSGVLLTAGD
jgi:hypothetical protein